MSLLRSIARSCSLAKLPKPLAVAGISTTLAVAHLCTTATPLYAESPHNSRSSTLFREASPAALRKPSSQLVFLSRNEERRKEWVGSRQVCEAIY